MRADRGDDIETILLALLGNDPAKLSDLICRVGRVPAGLDTSALGADVADFLDYYREHKLDHTYVYPGVFPALDCVRPQRSMAVLTNKPINPSIAICEALGLSLVYLLDAHHVGVDLTEDVRDAARNFIKLFYQIEPDDAALDRILAGEEPGGHGR